MRDKKTQFFTLGGACLLVWMVLNTFVCCNDGINLILLALIFGFVQFIQIPPVHHSRFGDNIISLISPEEGNRRKNVIFHKAGAAHAPENTMEGIQEAIRLGVKAVEIDVSFTKDNVGVLLHGPRLEDSTDGTGFVSEKTWEEVSQLNASAKSAHRDKFPHAKVPKLEDCVKECIDNDIVIFFDCKADPKQTAMLLTGLFQRYPTLYRQGIVCSFFPQIIYAVRQKDANIITGLTHRNHILEFLGDGTPRNKELWKRLVSPVLDRLLMLAHHYLFWYICGNSFFLLEKGAISGDAKMFWERLGIHVVAWTVNDKVERNHLVDSLGIPVITDGLVD